MITKWSGLADEKYYRSIARYCLPSWDKLPGEKFVVHDSDSINLNFINVVPWQRVANYECDWINVHNNRKKKTNNFWRKMQSQVWAVRNIKDCDFLVLLDTDIEILDFDTVLWQQEMQNFLDSNNVWATGRSQSKLHDSGVIVFNMKHPDLHTLINEYQNIWDSGQILELRKSYDGHAVESMFEKWPSYKIKNIDYGQGFHVYDIGLVHYGSKIPKEMRRVSHKDGKGIVEDYTRNKTPKIYKN